MSKTITVALQIPGQEAINLNLSDSEHFPGEFYYINPQDESEYYFKLVTSPDTSHVLFDNKSVELPDMIKTFTIMDDFEKIEKSIILIKSIGETRTKATFMLMFLPKRHYKMLTQSILLPIALDSDFRPDPDMFYIVAFQKYDDGTFRRREIIKLWTSQLTLDGDDVKETWTFNNPQLEEGVHTNAMNDVKAVQLRHKNRKYEIPTANTNRQTLMDYPFDFDSKYHVDIHIEANYGYVKFTLKARLLSIAERADPSEIGDEFRTIRIRNRDFAQFAKMIGDINMILE